MSLVMRQVFPSGGAHVVGKSTPHSQIWKSIGRPVESIACDMLAIRDEGETTGL